MAFTSLRGFNQEIDGPDYIHDYVRGSGAASLTTTPEPLSVALLGTGLAGVVVARRRRRERLDD